MSAFFQPPPDPWPAQSRDGAPPPWTGRPQGLPPTCAALSDVPLARSALAEIRIAYIDAYPEGFEVEIVADTSIGYHELRRAGDRSGPDVFGRHWPMAGESRGSLPAEMLRIGVQFSDGRAATSISGHDRPVGGPVMWSLSGGGSGRGGDRSAAGDGSAGAGGGSRFHQGYWISPLLPPGQLTLVCEWPVAEIPLVRKELDATSILDAAGRARAMFPDGDRVRRDDREWRLGSDADVAWINSGTVAGTAITAAIPASFPAHCALELPRGNQPQELVRHERAVIELLAGQTLEQPWWLGYLDTGASDVVFPYAPRTTLYRGCGYVLVQAGPQEAASWRERGFSWSLPELMFPADRSWLLSTMWDDDWTSIGGSEQLVRSFAGHVTLGPRTRRLAPGEGATPAG